MYKLIWRLLIVLMLRLTYTIGRCPHLEKKKDQYPCYINVVSNNPRKVFKQISNSVMIKYYLPTPPLGQDMTQGQFLSGV